MKENASLVFIGHVDSGKSTLTNNIYKYINYSIGCEEDIGNSEDNKNTQ